MLIGTCKTPKKVSANMDGIVALKAFQSTAAKSSNNQERGLEVDVTGGVGGGHTVIAIEMVERDASFDSTENPSVFSS